jgi:DNA invertase Pin-like site-specific DNA recombinase
MTVRVSTDSQNTETQKLAVLQYANEKHAKIDNWMEIKPVRGSRPKRGDWMNCSANSTRGTH